MSILENCIQNIEGNKIYYYTTSGDKSKPIVIFIHGLFGSGLIFKNIINFLNLLNIECLSIDLRGFGKSSNNTPRLKNYIYDTRVVLEKENILNLKNNKIYNNRKLILVGYSMGTIITSCLKNIIKDKLNCTLVHISPIINFKKRKIIKHISFLGVGTFHGAILLKPFSFLLLIYDIIKFKKFIDLNGYIISGVNDFCYCKGGYNFNGKITLLPDQDHYLIYKNPNYISKYIFNIIQQKKHSF